MSTITIHLEGDLESQIRESAQRRGWPLEKQVSEILARYFMPGPAASNALPKRESELLEKINLAISPETWDLYRELIAKKEARIISETELEMLLGIADQIEIANAERMRHLVELAKIRRVSLPQLMKNLGLGHA